MCKITLSKLQRPNMQLMKYEYLGIIAVGRTSLEINGQ